MTVDNIWLFINSIVTKIKSTLTLYVNRVLLTVLLTMLLNFCLFTIAVLMLHASSNFRKNREKGSINILFLCFYGLSHYNFPLLINRIIFVHVLLWIRLCSYYIIHIHVYFPCLFRWNKNSSRATISYMLYYNREFYCSPGMLYLFFCPSFQYWK